MRTTSTALAIALSSFTGVSGCAANELPEPARSEAGEFPWNVAIVVHEGVELLDFAGPAEVFSLADRAPGGDWFRVYTVAPDPDPILSQGVVTVQPEFGIADCPPPDLLVVPGGATRVLTDDAEFMDWVGRVVPECQLTLTVCTGAFVLAEQGFLEGREATTHWSALAALQAAAPGASVLEDVRFADSGEVVTTAGISAGLDGSLHVVARLLGRAEAERVARHMQYRWQPGDEALAGYPATNPNLDEHGALLADAEELRRSGRHEEAVASYRELLETRPEDGAAWYGLGYSLHVLGRLDEAIDAHGRAAENFAQPHRPLYNLACAHALQGDGELAFEALERAIDAGFASRTFLLADDDWAAFREDPAFRAIVDRLAAGR